MVLSTTKSDARTLNGEFITSTDLAVEDRDRTFFLFSSIFPVWEKFPKREIFPIQYDFSLFDLVFPTDYSNCLICQGFKRFQNRRGSMAPDQNTIPQIRINKGMIYIFQYINIHTVP